MKASPFQLLVMAWLWFILNVFLCNLVELLATWITHIAIICEVSWLARKEDSLPCSDVFCAISGHGQRVNPPLKFSSKVQIYI